jgi:hypothetical protein
MIAVAWAILTPENQEKPRKGASSAAARNVRDMVSRARTDQRALAVAIESYYVDNCIYPAWALGPQSVNGVWAKGTAAEQMPSFRLSNPKSKDRAFMTLTTPMAHITTYPKDVFSPDGDATFAFWNVFPGDPDASKYFGEPPPQVGGVGWILVSPGPDGDYDLLGEWDVYNPKIAQPSPRLMTGTNKKGDSYTYDPTNGTVSNGDMWRVKQ